MGFRPLCPHLLPVIVPETDGHGTRLIILRNAFHLDTVTWKGIHRVIKDYANCGAYILGVKSLFPNRPSYY